MKKTITTFVLSCIICTAFAQKNFKPIRFTSYRETQKSLDFNGDKDGPENRSSGSIIINAKDSLLTITPEGQTGSKYKITAIGDEKDANQYDKVTYLSCTDEAGQSYSVKIEREKTSTYTYMKIYLSPNNVMKYLTYYCDYIKKLY